MIPYNSEYNPPAPILSVDISAVTRPGQRLSVTALLDTAADISALPETIIEQLGLAPVAETMIAGFEDHPIQAKVYVVAIHIAGARLYPARVVVHPAQYARLGRNILNSLFVRLDGPDLMFEVSVKR